MSEHERWGRRSLAFSRWRRTLGGELVMIDIDSLDYCPHCKEPLLLSEVVRDVGQLGDFPKPTTVLRALARRAQLPAALVEYVESPDEQLVSLRAKLLVPYRAGITDSADDYADWLRALHEQHRSRCRAAAQSA